MTIRFTKMTGAGNDFILIDARESRLSLSEEEIVRLCDRHFGIGADGVMLLAPSEECDFAMLYYNSDGRLGSMCGNGGRCITRFAAFLGITPRDRGSYQFEANGKRYNASLTPEGLIRLRMQPAHSWRTGLSLLGRTVHFVDTGSPHAVLFLAEGEMMTPAVEGPLIRHHPEFAPDGCNVNFVTTVNDSTLTIRTFERGVEAETFACGTGAVASAIMAHHLTLVSSTTITLIVYSGDRLTVTFDSSYHDIDLIGPADILFHGDISRDVLSPRNRHHRMLADQQAREDNALHS